MLLFLLSVIMPACLGGIIVLLYTIGILLHLVYIFLKVTDYFKLK